MLKYFIPKCSTVLCFKRPVTKRLIAYAHSACLYSSKRHSWARINDKWRVTVDSIRSSFRISHPIPFLFHKNNIISIATEVFYNDCCTDRSTHDQSELTAKSAGKGETAYISDRQPRCRSCSWLVKKNSSTFILIGLRTLHGNRAKTRNLS